MLLKRVFFREREREMGDNNAMCACVYVAYKISKVAANMYISDINNKKCNNLIINE